MEVLKRDFSATDLEATLRESSVEFAISVQAQQCLEETEHLLAIADNNSSIVGVVGWVDLRSPDVGQQLDQFVNRPFFKAVRHVVQDEPDDRFILGESFNRGITEVTRRGLSYDILIFARQLPASIEFVDRHPNQVFVLDHIAKPTILSSQWDAEWEFGVRELAKRSNVFCKFSGVATEVRDADWDASTIRRYWDVALEAFGAMRLMYGSDWPVCLLRTAYRRWCDVVGEFASELSPDEQKHFWQENARSAYRLEMPALSDS